MLALKRAQATWMLYRRQWLVLRQTKLHHKINASVLNGPLKLQQHGLRAKEQLAQRDQQRASVEQARLRHQEAKNKLAALGADQATEQKTEPALKASSSDDPTLDRAATAIARAQKNAAEQALMSPEQKLQQLHDTLEKRLSKAQARLAQAKSEDSDQLEAFSNAVAILNEKIKAVDLELVAFDQSRPPANKQAEKSEETQ